MIYVLTICLFSTSVFSSESNWYVEFSRGSSELSIDSYEGRNTDTYCYPTSLCYVDESSRNFSGYVWKFSLDPLLGHSSSFSVGRSFNYLRLELSSLEFSNPLNQSFISLKHSDGSYWRGRTDNHSVVSNDLNLIGNFNSRIISLNLLRDINDVNKYVVPFFGAGSGVAFLTVRDVHYSNNYQDLSGETNDILSKYNVIIDDDYSDFISVMILHSGLNLRLYERLNLGIKASYIFLDSISDEASYIIHPMLSDTSSFTNTITFNLKNAKLISLSARYRLN